MPRQELHAWFVLDTSAAMRVPDLDHDGDSNTPMISRWQLVREGLEESVTLTETAHLGMQRLPGAGASDGYSTDACVVAATPEIDAYQSLGIGALLDVLPPATAGAEHLRGARPLRAALASVYAEVAESSEYQVVVVFTAGAPNCASGAASVAELLDEHDDAVLDLVAQALQELKAPTLFVGVGLPTEPLPEEADMEPDGINPAAVLDELAVAGGLPSADVDADYYRIDTADALTELLTELFEPEAEPTLALMLLHPVPSTMGLVVDVGGDLYGPLPVTDCETNDGWIFVDDARQEILLCGAAADAWVATQEATITYACQ